MGLHDANLTTSQSAAPRQPRDVTHDGPPFFINRQGEWFHGEVKISRISLARLFATILYHEPDGSYWLKNPAEICHVTVDDVPYVVHGVVHDGDGYILETTLGETFPLDEAHALTMRGDVPYALFRHGCAARLATHVYYALVREAREVDGQMVVTSNGADFILGPVT